MADSPSLTPDELRQLLTFNPDTGKLFWKERPVELFKHSGSWTAEHFCSRWNSRFANKEAFISINSGGYHQGRIHYRLHVAHRVIWAMYHDEWPKDEIDHINGNRRDNRVVNLREVNRVQNQQNMRMHSRNSSGFTGVSWSKKNACWRVMIQRRYIGQFSSLHEAVEAYEREKRILGFHPNHGKK